MANFYTGVGSRNTPVKILKIMTAVAKKLSSNGYTLRSGGAAGADSAFEAGAGNAKRIYLASESTSQSEKIASQFHPAWHRCSVYAKKLHGRNSFQVLGDDLDSPSEFLICWTADRCCSHRDRTIRTGGTGTAISIADHHNVKIFNLAYEPHLRRVVAYLRK